MKKPLSPKLSRTSPALQAQEPRLRRATLYYDMDENWTFFGGQKWSTAAGIKSSGSLTTGLVTPTAQVSQGS